LSGWAERAAAMLDLTPMMVGPHTPGTSLAPPPRPPAAAAQEATA
jgi:hypothetical protein